MGKVRTAGGPMKGDPQQRPSSQTPLRTGHPSGPRTSDRVLRSKHGECLGNQTSRSTRLYPWVDTSPWFLTQVLCSSVELLGAGPPGAPTSEFMGVGRRDASAAMGVPPRLSHPTVECAVSRHSVKRSIPPSLPPSHGHHPLAPYGHYPLPPTGKLTTSSHGQQIWSTLCVLDLAGGQLSWRWSCTWKRDKCRGFQRKALAS